MAKGDGACQLSSHMIATRARNARVLVKESLGRDALREAPATPGRPCRGPTRKDDREEKKARRTVPAGHSNGRLNDYQGVRGQLDLPFLEGPRAQKRGWERANVPFVVSSKTDRTCMHAYIREGLEVGGSVGGIAGAVS